MPNPARTVRDRIYADFLMPSRLPDYARMLEAFQAAGYAVVSLDRFWSDVRAGTADAAGPTVILRHDIDTDPVTGRRMWEIERGLGINASFFFRLSTLDVPLMQEISAAGGHASYHYEEIAAVAKRYRLRRPEQVQAHLDRIRAEFRRNLESLRGRTGLPLDIVASHGDFVNRRLGIPNWELLTDPTFRADVGIELEAYDDALSSHITSRHSDTGHPRYWVAEPPLRAVERGDGVVHVLVHPRHWRTARLVNLRDDLTRVAESLAFGRA